MVEYSLLD